MGAALFLYNKYTHNSSTRPIPPAAAIDLPDAGQGWQQTNQGLHYTRHEPSSSPYASAEPRHHLHWSWLSFGAAGGVVLLLVLIASHHLFHQFPNSSKPLRLVMATVAQLTNRSMPMDVYQYRHLRKQERTEQHHVYDLNSTGGRRAYLSDPGILPGSIPINTSLVMPDFVLDIHTSGLRYVCPVMTCSKAESCTQTNTSCCAYFMRHVWEFLVKFAAAHGMEKDYFAVYGSVVGAIREKEGMLPWTEDVDLGVSSRMVHLLESTIVRHKLWQYGYYFFWHGVWRLCSHGDHPHPVFRAAMTKPRMCPTVAPCPVATPLPPIPAGRPPLAPTPWYEDHLPAVYVDMYSAAPAAASTEGWSDCGDACLRAPADTSLPMAKHLWRVCMSASWVVVSFSRTANISGVHVVIPDNAEEHVAMVYGNNWRTPSDTHGQTLGNPNDCHRRGLFAGAPGVGKPLLF
jgi:hypothetical protein